MNAIQQLEGILRAVSFYQPNSETDKQRVAFIKNGTLTMLLLEGAEYQLNETNFVLNSDNDTFVVPISYVEAYIGKNALQNILSSQGEGQTIHYRNANITIASFPTEGDKYLTELENLVSALYQEIILGNQISIAQLNNKIKELTQENEALSKALFSEKAKNKALNDRLNIILGYSSFNLPVPASNEGLPTDFSIPYTPTKQDSESYEAPVNNDNFNFDDISISSSDDDNEEISIDDDTDTEFDEDEINDDELEAYITEDDDDDNINDEDEDDEKQYGLFPYSDDIYEMGKHSFCFTYNRLALTNDQEEVVDFAELMVVPLSTKEKYPNLLVWYTHGTDAITQVLEHKSKHTIDFGTFTISLSGTMKGNEFKSYVKYIKDGDTDVHLEIDSRNFGTLGHLYLADETDALTHVHICPITFTNNDDGFADYIYCVEQNGEYVQYGDNSEGEVLFEDTQGTMKKVLAKWTESSLYGMIGLPEVLG